MTVTEFRNERKLRQQQRGRRFTRWKGCDEVPFCDGNDAEEVEPTSNGANVGRNFPQTGSSPSVFIPIRAPWKFASARSQSWLDGQSLVSNRASTITSNVISFSGTPAAPAVDLHCHRVRYLAN